MSITSSVAKVVGSKKFLGGVIVVGVGLIAGTAITGTIVAKEHIEEAEAEKAESLQNMVDDDATEVDFEVADNIDYYSKLTKMETVKVVWKDYLPMAAAMCLTLTAFIKLFRNFSKENAALHGLLSVSEATVHHLQDQMVRQIGEKKTKPIINDAKQKAMEENEPVEVINKRVRELKTVDEEGNELLNFCCPWTKRTFQMSKVQGLRALEDVNLMLRDYGEARLNDFFSSIPIEECDAGDIVVWHLDRFDGEKLTINWDGGLEGAYIDKQGKAWTYLSFNKELEIANNDR